MLDKSVDFKNIIMRIESDKIAITDEPNLPEDFDFRLFRSIDDVKNWARIETSVLEFKSQDEAENYFTKAFLPYIDELKNRCLFVINKEGLPIATATAWFANSELGHQACLAWVSVCPEYQGLGLGKSVVKKALSLFKVLEPGCAVWLHTQTWSHKAVKLYHSLGFNMMKIEKLANMNTLSGETKIYVNDYPEAIEVLKQVMDEGTLEKIVTTAI